MSASIWDPSAPAGSTASTIPFDPDPDFPSTVLSVQAALDYLNGFVITQYARTASEISAGVVPVNYGYVPGDVRRYGAIGDLDNDDTVAIQTAVDANGGKVIFFPTPPVGYKITNTIYMRAAQTKLLVWGTGVSDVFNFSPYSAFVFDRADPLATGFVGYCGIAKIRIGGNPAGVVAKETPDRWAVRVIKQENFTAEDISWDGFYYGIEVAGGQANRFNNLYGASPNPVSGIPAPAGSCHMAFRSAATSGPRQQCYTVEVEGFTFSGSSATDLTIRMECIFRIENTDGLHIDNGYIAHAGNALVIIEPKESQNVSACFFTNTYFDGVNLTPRAVRTYQANATNTCAFNLGSGCFLGQTANEALYVRGSTVRSIVVEGTRISNCGAYAINFDAGTSSRLLLNSSVIAGTSGGVIYQNGQTVMVADTFFNTITGIGNNAVRLLGTIDRASINGNQFTAVDGEDFVNLATLGKLVYGNNNTDSMSSECFGLRIGNQANDDPLALDWYEEQGTLAPVVLFGGTGGNTYSLNEAETTQIGNLVTFGGIIRFSALGAGVGAATIPLFVTGVEKHAAVNLCVTNLNAAIGTAFIQGFIADGGTAIELYRLSGGSRVALTKADFTATTEIIFTVTYFV